MAYNDPGDGSPDPNDPYADPNYDPYHDPSNYAGAGQPTPAAQGGYATPPPDYNGTGSPQQGWLQGQNGLWNFTDPSANTPGRQFNFPTYHGGSSPNFNWSAPPGFNAPQFNAPPAFAAPSMADVLKDPGYGFRLNQGEQALQQSAAGRGTLRTGGTLKDILRYGQDLASQEYNNVFNRSADVYRTNYGVSRDVFDRQYQGARDEYAPQYDYWMNSNRWGENQATQGFNRDMDLYRTQLDDLYRYYQGGVPPEVAPG